MSYPTVLTQLCFSDLCHQVQANFSYPDFPIIWTKFCPLEKHTLLSLAEHVASSPSESHCGAMEFIHVRLSINLPRWRFRYVNTADRVIYCKTINVWLLVQEAHHTHFSITRIYFPIWYTRISIIQTFSAEAKQLGYTQGKSTEKNPEAHQ